MVLVAIALLVMMHADMFLAVRQKNRLENAGDAAALAAAKVQGRLINEIGEANIQHIIAAIKGDAAECERLSLDVRRKALIGPVEALERASEAAKENGLAAWGEFDEILMNHVDDIRLAYMENAETGGAYVQSYQGAWGEYADAIERAVASGLAAGCDNMEFYYAGGNHWLKKKAFYNAIAARDWCWFLFHCEALLNNYVSYADWGGVLPYETQSTVNSEIFSLHLDLQRCALLDIFTPEEIRTHIMTFTGNNVESDDIERCDLLADPSQTWAFFDMSRWGRWFDENMRLAGEEDSLPFPLAGEIKEQYNVRGAAAVCRVITEGERLANGGERRNTWVAAAKAFGKTGEGKVTAIKGFVVPCMEDVRLVSVDAAGGEDLATAELEWVVHLRDHLPHYLAEGPRQGGFCSYCRCLKDWEKPSWHTSGVHWLKYNSGQCIRPIPGGHGRGGTSHGH